MGCRLAWQHALSCIQLTPEDLHYCCWQCDSVSGRTTRSALFASFSASHRIPEGRATSGYNPPNRTTFVHYLCTLQRLEAYAVFVALYPAVKTSVFFSLHSASYLTVLPLITTFYLPPEPVWDCFRPWFTLLAYPCFVFSTPFPCVQCWGQDCGTLVVP